MRTTGLIVVVALVTAGADAASKSAAESLGPTPASVPAYNPDLMLQWVSLGSSLHLMLAVVVGAAAAVLLGTWARRGLVPVAAAGLIVGGCLGNAADRLALGAVRDFLVLGPVVANLADLALVVGLAWCLGSAARALGSPPLGCVEQRREG